MACPALETYAGGVTLKWGTASWTKRGDKAQEGTRQREEWPRSVTLVVIEPAFLSCRVRGCPVGCVEHQASGCQPVPLSEPLPAPLPEPCVLRGAAGPNPALALCSETLCC